MGEHESGQVAASAAEVYETFFVPALFGEWPSRVLAAADVKAGDRVLDVACGTGILARNAVSIVGDAGEVVGVDINEGMLAVARSNSQAVAWQAAPAEALPFPDASFDRVVSQFGLMFFENRAQAIAEMLRVLRPGGAICVAIWAPLADSPGYWAVAQLLADLFGPAIAKSMEAPFCLGDKTELQRLFAGAGAGEIAINTVEGKARFASIDAWIYTDIKGWTLADVINDKDYERLREAAQEALSPFMRADGSVEFASPAHLVTVRR